MAARVPQGVLLVVVSLLLGRILFLNEGRLVYTLDDAYIHLAVAESIAQGEYGVNPGEPSAPASSIVYPFLLAPLALTGLAEWMPLVIGLIAAMGTVALWTMVVGRALGLGGRDGPVDVDVPRGRAALAGALIVILLMPATNLIGVLFTGMEHTLQLLAVALVIAGLVEERETGEMPWWLVLGIVAGPLVRYENLALSIPAIVYLGARGRWRPALGSLLLLGAALAAFSLFLLAQGHGALPTSVLLKSGAAGGGLGLGAVLDGTIARMGQRQGVLMTALLVGFLVGAVGARAREDRRLALWGAAVLALHLVAGRFGHFRRYEPYAWSAGLLMALYLLRFALRGVVRRFSIPAIAVAGVLVSAVIAWPYVRVTLRTPLGSNNIYEQQYQMHRFATEFYRGPVAVTDLGWVAYRNDAYVLDLWGLANRRAADARLAGDEDYMRRMVQEYDVGLAMLYGVWYPVPPEGWEAVGEIALGKERVTPAETRVTFYATRPGEVMRIRRLLEEFGPTLPPGVELSIFD